MLLLLLSSLEATMAKLGGCVDELEPDVLKSHTGCLLEKRLPQCYHSLLRPNTAALYHDVVVLHNTIVRETTHWCNILLGPDSSFNFKIQYEHIITHADEQTLGSI